MNLLDLVTASQHAPKTNFSEKQERGIPVAVYRRQFRGVPFSSHRCSVDLRIRRTFLAARIRKEWPYRTVHAIGNRCLERRSRRFGEGTARFLAVEESVARLSGVFQIGEHRPTD